jgi:hypothetical protein
MPSRALAIHLEALLHDAEELGVAHTRLRTGARGRQWGLGSINRASVVLCVSAWEAYLEEVLRESMRCLRPSTGPVGIPRDSLRNASGYLTSRRLGAGATVVGPPPEHI